MGATTFGCSGLRGSVRLSLPRTPGFGPKHQWIQQHRDAESPWLCLEKLGWICLCLAWPQEAWEHMSAGRAALQQIPHNHRTELEGSLKILQFQPPKPKSGGNLSSSTRGDGAQEPWKDVPVFPCHPGSAVLAQCRECKKRLYLRGHTSGTPLLLLPEGSHPWDTPAAVREPLAHLGVTKAVREKGREHPHARGVYGQQEGGE